MKKTRLTMAQALLCFLDNQYIELDGTEHKFVQGVMGIFGHGNVTGLGEALEYGDSSLSYIQGNNEPLARAMLKLCHKRMEEIIGKKLKAVRSFYRIYAEDSYLKPHIDDGELEYSVTINMGSKGPEGYCWPIYIEDLDGEREDILLYPTDALVYNGSKLRHGREKFLGLYQTQLFLHYKEVKKDG